jgi:hypothetical protein
MKMNNSKLKNLNTIYNGIGNILSEIFQRNFFKSEEPVQKAVKYC